MKVTIANLCVGVVIGYATAQLAALSPDNKMAAVMVKESHSAPEIQQQALSIAKPAAAAPTVAKHSDSEPMPESSCEEKYAQLLDGSRYIEESESIEQLAYEYEILRQRPDLLQNYADKVRHQAALPIPDDPEFLAKMFVPSTTVESARASAAIIVSDDNTSGPIDSSIQIIDMDLEEYMYHYPTVGTEESVDALEK